VVSGTTLVWLVNHRQTFPRTVFEACLMMRRQVWGTTPQFVSGFPFAVYSCCGRRYLRARIRHIHMGPKDWRQPDAWRGLEPLLKDP
jgi:hypothetical protein